MGNENTGMRIQESPFESWDVNMGFMILKVCSEALRLRVPGSKIISLHQFKSTCKVVKLSRWPFDVLLRRAPCAMTLGPLKQRVEDMIDKTRIRMPRQSQDSCDINWEHAIYVCL